MNPKAGIFSNMTLVDWVLAVVFTVIVAFLFNNLFPTYGWAIGIVIALGLLYLAKRRRDKLQNPIPTDRV